ncbi:MAG TPA: hypothetical protein VIK91_04520 [Nannocystis sp.]
MLARSTAREFAHLSLVKGRPVPHHTRPLAFLLLPTALALTGCFLVEGGDDDDGGVDPVQNDIAQYEQLRLQLEGRRELVLPTKSVDDVRAAGPWLVWLDIDQGWSAVLHARRYPGGEEVVSEVPLGDEQTPPNYEIGEELGMTALTVGSDARYSVFRLATGALLDEVTMKKPATAKYDAYGVFGEQAYIVAEDENLAVYEWTPGKDTPTKITALGDAGVNFGAWVGFVVTEDEAGTRRLVGIGTLGTYSLDLSTLAVTQVPLPVMPLEGAINEHGIAVIESRKLWWYDWGAAQARALHDEIAASGYQLGATFAQAHHVGSGFAAQDVAVDGTTLYYRGNSGIFAYDVAARTVTPVLLDDINYSGAGLFVTYTGLAAGDGSLFAVGLQSMSGATGADGPVYRIPPVAADADQDVPYEDKSTDPRRAIRPTTICTEGQVRAKQPGRRQARVVPRPAGVVAALARTC